MNETKTILITGGSGFIGTKLTQALLDKGYAVVVADLGEPRIKHELLTFEKLNLSHDEIPKKYDGVLYGIIHLAGKNIFGRWTEGFKKGVYESRIVSRLKKLVKHEGVANLALQDLLREYFSSEVELMFALRKELKSRSDK